LLELKFAIYYRAASLPSQASYAVLPESQAFFKHSPHTNSMRNNYISLLSDLDLCACVHVKIILRVRAIPTYRVYWLYDSYKRYITIFATAGNKNGIGRSPDLFFPCVAKNGLGTRLGAGVALPSLCVSN